MRAGWERNVITGHAVERAAERIKEQKIMTSTTSSTKTLSIKALSAEDKARLVLNGGQRFAWLDESTIAAKHSRGWSTYTVDDTGSVKDSGSSLILPPRKIERKVALHLQPKDMLIWDDNWGRSRSLNGDVACIRLDLSAITEGDGLDPACEVPLFRLERVK